jgi:hypothetical protein
MPFVRDLYQLAEALDGGKIQEFVSDYLAAKTTGQKEIPL